MTNSVFVIGFSHVGSKNRWRSFIRFGIKSEHCTFIFCQFSHKFHFLPQFWNQSQGNNFLFEKFSFYLVKIVSLSHFEHWHLKRRRYVLNYLDTFYQVICLIFIIELDKVGNLVAIGPDYHLNNFHFYGFFKSWFIRKENAVRLYFTLLQTITFRNFPFFNLPFIFIFFLYFFLNDFFLFFLFLHLKNILSLLYFLLFLYAFPNLNQLHQLIHLHFQSMQFFTFLL